MQSNPTTSEDCLNISNHFSSSNLIFNNPTPFIPFDNSINVEPQLNTTPTKTIPTINTNKVDMMSSLEHFELYTKPGHITASTLSEVSESSSISISASSYFSSVASTTSQDWILQSLSNVDILAPTVPDLSFSFVPSSSQQLTPLVPSALVINQQSDDIHAEMDLNRSIENVSLLKFAANKRNSAIMRPTTADSSLKPNLNNNNQTKSPSINSIRSGTSHRHTKSPSFGGIPKVKSHHRFLSGHSCGRNRNSSYLESQLEFLTQHSSPMFHNDNNEFIMMAQTQQEPNDLDQEPSKITTKEPVSFKMSSRKEDQKRISSILRLGNKPNNMDMSNNQRNKSDGRQRRLSASNLLDKANFLFFNSTGPNHFQRSDSDENVDTLPKACLDPTLVNNHNTASTSASHMKSSRSFFNLISSKLR